jgi:primary-amine oxidase
MALKLDTPAPTTLPQILHPLDPLSTAEITAAVAILRASGKLGPHVRFATVVLQEPAKEVVLNFKAGDPIEREAFAIILDNDDGATYEAVVSITSSMVQGWKHIPGVQPCVMLDEFFECENTVKADPAFQEALRKRGITDFLSGWLDPARDQADGHYEHGRVAARRNP